jgi:hypothetical protein
MCQRLMYACPKSDIELRRKTHGYFLPSRHVIISLFSTAANNTIPIRLAIRPS